MSDKARLRARRRARVISAPEHARQSAAVCAQLLALEEIVRSKAVALFAGIAHEPDMRGVFEGLAPRERWLPKILDATALGWARVEAWSSMVPARMGIPEPDGELQTALPTHVEVVLVPGLAFDARGGRLGWGRGYYDRALAQHPGALRVGVTLSGGIVEAVPMDAHDLPMHVVVSPKGALRVGGENARVPVR